MIFGKIAHKSEDYYSPNIPLCWKPRKFPVSIETTLALAKALDFPRLKLLEGLLIHIEDNKIDGYKAIQILKDSLNTGNIITDLVLPELLIKPHWEYYEQENK